MERLDKVLEGVADIRESVAGVKSDVSNGFKSTTDSIARLDSDVRDMRTRITILEVAHHQQKGVLGGAKALWAVICLFAGIAGAWLKSRLG